MRRVVLFVSVFLAVSVLNAADTPKPDYSQEHLRELFAQNEEPPKPQPNVRWGPAGVEFRAFGINWRLLYLPILAPFSGSVRGTDPWSKFPDPFALTHTEFAETPRTWRDTREISKERKRIEKMMKERAKVKVDQ
ncbi:MAG: hypothetical protein ACXVJT_10145 [Thermoanaerobaculia bacterium]